MRLIMVLLCATVVLVPVAAEATFGIIVRETFCHPTDFDDDNDGLINERVLGIANDTDSRVCEVKLIKLLGHGCRIAECLGPDGWSCSIDSRYG